MSPRTIAKVQNFNIGDDGVALLLSLFFDIIAKFLTRH
jgi:hypothetical protein